VLILLPPSETKRTGGVAGTRLDLSALSYPQLHRARREALRGLRAVSRNRATAVAALHLGATQHDQVALNRAVGTSPTLPAIDRYTGVLFDALDAASLPHDARGYLGGQVIVHSAAFGLLGALDAIPTYRLSHDSRLPDRPLRAIWSHQIEAVLDGTAGLVLDARSEGYVALGPAPSRGDSLFLRVIALDSDGRRRALNHTNKHAKGELVRALAVSGAVLGTPTELVDWGASHGFRLELASGQSRAEVHLVVAEARPTR
jgi:uncharacterized protein